jgi:hypothetical protein
MLSHLANHFERQNLRLRNLKVKVELTPLILLKCQTPSSRLCLVRVVKLIGQDLSL